MSVLRGYYSLIKFLEYKAKSDFALKKKVG